PVDAEDWDFDLPGSGILIWHYDQRAWALGTGNWINSNNQLRGLDLEEADGAQDIGQTYEFLTPGYGTDYGIADDAWYRSNRAHQEANGGRAVEFSSSTYPSTHTTEGLISSIRLTRFSEPDTIASFYFTRDYFINPQPIEYSSQITIGGWGQFLSDSDSSQFLTITKRLITIWSQNGELLLNIPLDTIWGEPNRSEPLIVYDPETRLSRALWSVRNRDGIGSLLMVYIPSSYPLPVVEVIHRYPDPLNLPPQIIAPWDTTNGNIYFIHSEGIPRDPFSFIYIFTLQGEIISHHTLPGAVTYTALIGKDTLWLVTSTSEIYQLTSEGLDPSPANPHLKTSLRDRNWYSVAGRFFHPQEWALAFFSFLNDEPQQILVVKNPFSAETWEIKDQPINRAIFRLSEGAHSSPPDDEILGIFPPLSSADIDRDGREELLLRYRGSYYIWEVSGTLSSPPLFPRENFLSYLAATGQFNSEIPGFLGVGTRGNSPMTNPLLKSFALTLSPIKFPPSPETLLTLRLKPQGIACNITPSSPHSFNRIAIWDSTHLDFLSFPEIGDGFTVLWTGRWGGPEHKGVANLPPVSPFTPMPGTDILNFSECYNWPNPASDRTFIRYNLYRPAEVTITIYDITGIKIAKFSGPGDMTGVPIEVEWNLEDIARGGYFAVVEARSGGKVDRKRINIAVQK
ncbi:MAG: hypothetical protein ACK4OO_03380, partial [bacterium]